MAKILEEEDFQKLLDATNNNVYIYQKEKDKENMDRQWMYEQDGSMIVLFTSPIFEVEPTKEDVIGKIWNPRLKDKDGNPLKDRFGKLREAWPKFEAKCIVKDKDMVYGLGSKDSIHLKILMSEMKKVGINNKQLPGTKWKIKCKDKAKFNWEIDFIGKGEVPKPKEEKESKSDDIYKKVTQALTLIKEKNAGKVLVGIGKDDLMDGIGFFANLNEKQVEGAWKKLLEDGIIREENGKIFFN